MVDYTSRRPIRQKIPRGRGSMSEFTIILFCIEGVTLSVSAGTDLYSKALQDAG